MDIAPIYNDRIVKIFRRKNEKEGVMKKLLTGIIVVLVILCFMQATSAEASYTGTRTYSSGQLMADDEWASAISSISFEVTQLESGLWSYTYTFTMPGGSGSVPMNFVKLEVSKDVPNAEYWYVNSAGAYVSLMPQMEFFHLWDASASAPNYYLYGLYMSGAELSDSSITFISTQSPMWGSFYARGPSGDPPEMTNTGFPNDFDTSQTEWIDGKLVYKYNGSSAPTFTGSLTGADNWILVPDTVVTPEPATLLLLGLGLIGLAGVRRRLHK
jgi:hypothetical protein